MIYNNIIYDTNSNISMCFIISTIHYLPTLSFSSYYLNLDLAFLTVFIQIHEIVEWFCLISWPGITWPQSYVKRLSNGRKPHRPPRWHKNHIV